MAERSTVVTADQTWPPKPCAASASQAPGVLDS
jgi:hypothetical protein